MKTVGMLLATLALCSQVQAGGYGGQFRATCNHGGYQAQNYGHQQNYGHGQNQYAAGTEIQDDAAFKKRFQPLLDKQAATERALQSVQSELAALRGDVGGLSKTLKDGLLGLSGTFQGTFTGGAGPVNPPQPVPPSPNPQPQPNPSPSPTPVDPDKDAGPLLTPFMQELMVSSCNVCHDGTREVKLPLDAGGFFTAGKSSEIWARIFSDEKTKEVIGPDGKPKTIQWRMPPEGSTDKMRSEATIWIGSAAVQQIQHDVLSRKGTVPEVRSKQRNYP